MELRRGDSGLVIGDVQRQLFALSLYTGKPDDDFGPLTEKAVVAAQQKARYRASGILDGKVTEWISAQLRPWGLGSADRELPVQELTREVKLSIMQEISRFEGKFWSCNLDGEFKGLFDRPSRDAKNRPIPPKDRTTRHSSSRFGATPGHIGLSWGFIQFTQNSGSLGRVLQRCHDIAPGAFRATFGPQWSELLDVTNRKGAPVPVPDSESVTGVARRSPRVRPIEGKDLWEQPWVARFIEAGHNPAFQAAQIEMAMEDYLEPTFVRICLPWGIESAKGIAILTDRAVHSGRTGAERVIRQACADMQGWDEPLLLARIYSQNTERPWRHRMEKLSRSKGLTWQRYR